MLFLSAMVAIIKEKQIKIKYEDKTLTGYKQWTG